jgi:hypothetical protein
MRRALAVPEPEIRAHLLTGLADLRQTLAAALTLRGSVGHETLAAMAVVALSLQSMNFCVLPTDWLFTISSP